MGNAEEKTAKSRQVEDAMITGAIEVIAVSPFARTNDGRRVVHLLRHWHASHWIRYGPGDPDERGSCINTVEFKEITVKQEYSGNLKVTVPTLVHEGTHATWRHKFRSDQEAARCDAGEDEYWAQVNEVAVYEWLRDTKGYPEDFELELRLKRFKEGTLRVVVMNGKTGKTDPQCPTETSTKRRH